MTLPTLRCWLLLAVCATVLPTLQTRANEPQPARLAIVIDDIGYSLSRGQRAATLPGPITLAVLPFAPNTDVLVSTALAQGKTILIHQPMEPQPSPHAREEAGTLKLHMTEPDFSDTLAAALAAVPSRVGLSNHTGSLLTQHETPMRRIMAQLKQHNLIFLDSRTTPQTVALRVAREYGIPALRRDVFLDGRWRRRRS